MNNYTIDFSSPKTEGLVPDLRFPEFLDAGEWELTIVADNCNIKGRIGYRGYTKQDLVKEGQGVFVIGGKHIKHHQLDLSDPTFLSWEKYYESPEIMVEIDHIIFSQRGTLGDCVLIEREIGKATINPSMVLLKDITCNTRFLYYVLIGEFIQTEVAKNSTSSAIPMLSQKQIGEFPFNIPKLPEQQKIASCLSSLDEVIAAHRQKLGTLKEHKKSLMQNLFPQGEERVPTYRFPEFREEGDWEEKTLGEVVSKVGSGVTPLGGESVYKRKGIPFVRSQNVSWGFFLLWNIAYIDENTHQNAINTELEIEDVLLNITGASIGRSAVVNEQVSGGNVNQHVCIIRTRKSLLNPFFLCQYLISNSGQSQIDSFQAGGNRQGLNFAQIRSFSVPIPSNLKEQQKIASCLSSLDDLISAQAEKIEQLKLHKKGLMQGLFPKVSA